MSLNQPITSFMRTALRTVTKSSRLSEVRNMMVEHHLHHVPVISDDGELVGLISFTDLLSLGFGADLGTGSSLKEIIDERFPISEVMQRDLVTIGSRGTLADAARMLGTGRFHSLPVIDGDGQLLGMVTSTDLIQHLAELLE
jgi:CBS domain-containing protein